MARVAPQAAVQYPAGISRVGFEALQLPIPAGFERKACQPKQAAKCIQPAQRCGRGLRLGQQQRRGYQPQQCALQQKYLQQAAPNKAAAPLQAPGTVAEVFRAAAVALPDVCAQARTPDGDQRCHQQLARQVAGTQRKIHPGQQHKAGAPKNIHDGSIAQAQAEQPEQQHAQRNQAQSGQVDGGPGNTVGGRTCMRRRTGRAGSMWRPCESACAAVAVQSCTFAKCAPAPAWSPPAPWQRPHKNAARRQREGTYRAAEAGAAQY